MSQSVLSRLTTRRQVARNAQRGLTLLEIMIVIAILGLLVVIVVPRVMGALGSSKIDLTKVQVDKISREYYPRFYAANGDNPCPASLIEIGKFIDGNMTEDEFKDPWGSPLKFSCGAGNLPAGVKDGIAVWSIGEDKQDGNADDIKSWEKPKH
ncbi:MAG: prepilin-type N-terminal cleavage/methylation domain-containing protein [Kofleriaceae bacterium]